MCKSKLLWRFIMAKLKNIVYRTHGKRSSSARIGRQPNRSHRICVEDYISKPECDLSGVTDEQIDSLGLTPMARAEVMRIVQNHRQGYNH